jgi:deazaflavin-dependent oxidoreductase (nitroreductase family)
LDHGPEEPAFPEFRWGRSDSTAAQVAQWFVSTRFGTWVMRAMVPLDRQVLLRSGGRYSAFGPIGAPLLVLTTTGSRSREPRTTPLLYLIESDEILIAGSNFGRERHPAWSTDLMAQPEAEVTFAGEDISVKARLLSGSERERAWERFCDAARPYRVYAARTDRMIRVFALTRSDPGPDAGPGPSG